MLIWSLVGRVQYGVIEEGVRHEDGLCPRKVLLLFGIDHFPLNASAMPWSIECVADDALSTRRLRDATTLKTDSSQTFGYVDSFSSRRVGRPWRDSAGSDVALRVSLGRDDQSVLCRFRVRIGHVRL